MKAFKNGLLFFFLLFALPFWGLAQETEEVVTSGVGTIIGGDQAKARDDALQDALRNAVEQVVGTLVSSQTLVENFQTVEDNIYTKSRGYIRNYTVVSEGKGEEGLTYEVKIKAIVRLSEIKDDLAAIGVLLERKHMPRMMVLMEEKNIGETEYSGVTVSLGIAESAIIERFREKGFEFIDEEVAKKEVDRDKAEAALEGDANAAAAIGRAYQAEVIITGKAFAKSAAAAQPMLAGMHSMQATIQAKAINVDNARILVSKTESAAAVHLDEVAGGTQAIQKAATTLADYMIGEILKRWGTELTSGMTVTLRVRGLKSFNDLTDLINALKYEVRGVKAVRQRDFSGGTALLDVETRGDAQSLARELSMKDLEKFAVQVTGQTQNKVNIKVSKKKAQGAFQDTTKGKEK